MRAIWAASDGGAAGGGAGGAAAGALDGDAAAGAPASCAVLERANGMTTRRVTTARAIGFTGEVYIGYAPRS